MEYKQRPGDGDTSTAHEPPQLYGKTTEARLAVYLALATKSSLPPRFNAPFRPDIFFWA